MTKPTIVTRAGKGSALTWTEGDANLTNLRDATIAIKAGTGGTDVVSDLNGTVTLVAGTNVTISGDNTAKTVTINAAGGSGITDLVQDLSPQLGGDLDVNGKNITSASNGNINITPNGSGNISLAPATGKIILGALDWPTSAGTNGQVLTTNGTGATSWTTVSGGLTDIVNDTTPQLGGNLDVNGKTLVNTLSGSPTSIDITTKDIILTPGNTGIGSNGNVRLGTLYFPNSDGTNTQVLATNGTGQLYWTAGGGSGTVTSVGGTGTVNGLTLTGTVTTSGNLTLGGTLDLSAPPAIGATTPAAITGTKLSLPSTAISAAAWTTAGIGISAPVRTYTDTSSSGTVASNYIHSLTGATIASTNTTTVTNAATLFLGAPGAGTNTTITNGWALYTTGNARIGRIYQQRNASVANWGTLGAQFTIDAATITNTTSSGTIAALYTNTFNAPTVAATNATVVTDHANLYVANPVASTNMTFTNNWGILTDGAIKSAGLTSTGAVTVNAAGELRLADSDSSNYVGFKSPATVSANKVWTLPSADGTANQVLKTDGAGTLGWATAGGGATVAWISQDSIKGTLITGSTYRQTISEVSDPSGIITVTSNQFTVAAGTYMVEFIGINKCTTVGAVFQHALYNVTGAVNIDNYIGVLLSDGTSATRYVHQWVAVITPASSNTYEFRCLLDATTNTVTNPGGAAGFRITKIG